MKNGQKILQGKSSITPTLTPLKVEAQALLMAVKEIKKLGYENVIFVGDNKTLFDSINRMLRYKRKHGLLCPRDRRNNG